MTEERVGEEVKVKLKGGDGDAAVHDCSCMRFWQINMWSSLISHLLAHIKS